MQCICLTRSDEMFRVHLNTASPGRQDLYVVLTMWEHVGGRGVVRVCGQCSVVCEVWMVLVCCVKLDGVRWAGSSEYMACSTSFDEVLRVCAKSQPIEPGSIVLAMSTTSIVRTSDCLYIICSHVCLHVCV